jgi:glutamate-1-semialdehyde aminotransferase
MHNDPSASRRVAVIQNFFVAQGENAALWNIEGRPFVDFARGNSLLIAWS